MGVGMVVVVAAERARELRDHISEQTWVIGEIVPGDRRVVLA
jgi:phosphoribosylaminoimidazole (AIR) synthetase